jgi:phenylacetate-CoA ligase
MEDLTQLPVSSKGMMRKAAPGTTLAHSVDEGRLVRRRTGGSTGEPFTILRHPLEDHLLQVFRRRAESQLGVRPWHRCAPVSELPLLKERRTWSRRALDALGLFREEQLDLYQPANETLDRLVEIAPDVIRGYPHALAHIGEAMTERHREAIRPKVVLSGGEQLTDSLRLRIQQAFGREPLDRYGAHEFNLLAWRCLKSDVMHTCDDSVIVEILRDGRPVEVGQWGEVVVTSLFSYAQPFIRYRNGDLATRGPEVCDCGQPFSSIQSVVGRSTDYFQMPDGTLIHPFSISGPFLKVADSWVKRYQLVRESAHRIVIRLVPLEMPSVDALEAVRAIGREAVPEDVAFSVELVEEIPVKPMTKFPLYVDLDPPEPNALDGS